MNMRSMKNKLNNALCKWIERKLYLKLKMKKSHHHCLIEMQQSFFLTIAINADGFSSYVSFFFFSFLSQLQIFLCCTFAATFFKKVKVCRIKANGNDFHNNSLGESRMNKLEQTFIIIDFSDKWPWFKKAC